MHQGGHPGDKRSQSRSSSDPESHLPGASVTGRNPVPQSFCVFQTLPSTSVVMHLHVASGGLRSGPLGGLSQGLQIDPLCLPLVPTSAIWKPEDRPNPPATTV